MSDTKEYLALYSTDCITCSHLSEAGTLAHVKCHHTKGNALCPAKEVRLVVVGKALECAQKLLKARDNRNAKLEAKIMQYVGAQSEAFKSKFYDYVENGGNIQT